MRQAQVIMDVYNNTTEVGNASFTVTYEEVYFYFYFYKVTVPALFGIIMLIGLVGNSLVTVVILSKRKMQTRVNILILNLAISDLIFLVICVPFIAYRYAADNWQIGETICKLSQYLIYVTMYVTMYTLVAISIVRYVIVVHSNMSAKINFTMTNIGIMICCIWIINLLANTYAWMYYKVRVIQAPGYPPYYYCAIGDVTKGKSIIISFFVVGYVVPLILISVLYILLVRHLKAVRERSSLGNANRTGHKKSANISHILITVVVVMAMCWLPLHVHFLIVYVGIQPEGRGYEIYRVLGHCLAYANSCMNPIIYNYVSMDFRKNFRSILSCPALRRSSHQSPKRLELHDKDTDINVKQNDRML